MLDKDTEVEVGLVNCHKTYNVLLMWERDVSFVEAEWLQFSLQGVRLGYVLLFFLRRGNRVSLRYL